MSEIQDAQATASTERSDIQDSVDSLQEALTGLDESTTEQLEALGFSVEGLVDSLESVQGDISQLDESTTEALEALGVDLGDLADLQSEFAEDVAEAQQTAADERAELQEAIIAVGGDVNALDEATQEQFEEFGETVSDLFSDVDVDIEALQEGQISQAEAQQAFEESVGQQFTDISGEIGGVQSDIKGLGQEVSGLGQGLADLGVGIGAGLLGLAGQQEQLPQQIAAMMPREAPEFKKFMKKLGPRKTINPLTMQPLKQKDAVGELNKFIGRASGTAANRRGMFEI